VRFGFNRFIFGAKMGAKMPNVQIPMPNEGFQPIDKKVNMLWPWPDTLKNLVGKQAAKMMARSASTI
jgi:hypothetical protein